MYRRENSPALQMEEDMGVANIVPNLQLSSRGTWASTIGVRDFKSPT